MLANMLETAKIANSIPACVIPTLNLCVIWRAKKWEIKVAASSAVRDS
jgi:hypothetical protein